MSSCECKVWWQNNFEHMQMHANSQTRRYHWGLRWGCLVTLFPGSRLTHAQLHFSTENETIRFRSDFVAFVVSVRLKAASASEADRGASAVKLGVQQRMRMITPLQQWRHSFKLQASPDTHRPIAGQAMCSLFDPDNLWPGRTDGARVVVDQPSHFIIGPCSTRGLRRVFNQLLLLVKTASPRYLSKQSANGDYRCSSMDETKTPEDELTKAAANGHTARVESLLRAGAQVNGVNRFGRTALQVSVTRCASSFLFCFCLLLL